MKSDHRRKKRKGIPKYCSVAAPGHPTTDDRRQSNKVNNNHLSTYSRTAWITIGLMIQLLIIPKFLLLRSKHSISLGLRIYLLFIRGLHPRILLFKPFGLFHGFNLILVGSTSSQHSFFELTFLPLASCLLAPCPFPQKTQPSPIPGEGCIDFYYFIASLYYFAITIL
jgi:hypothetical protein